MTSLNLVIRDFRTQRRTANTGRAPVIAPFRPGRRIPTMIW